MNKWVTSLQQAAPVAESCQMTASNTSVSLSSEGLKSNQKIQNSVLHKIHQPAVTIILFYDPEHLTALPTLHMQFGPEPILRACPSNSSVLKPTASEIYGLSTSAALGRPFPLPCIAGRSDIDGAQPAVAQSTALPKSVLPKPVTGVFSQRYCQANSQLCIEEGKWVLFPFFLFTEGSDHPKSTGIWWNFVSSSFGKIKTSAIGATCISKVPLRPEVGFAAWRWPECHRMKL